MAMGVIMVGVMGMPMGMGMIMVVFMAVAMGMVVVMVVVMVVIMAVAMGFMGLFTGFRFPGPGDFHRAGSLSASAGFTHGYSFCSTSKDLICSSVPLISRMPG